VSLVAELGAFAHRHRDAEKLPPEVAASVRQRVLDVVGLCLAALPLDTSTAIRDFAAAQGGAPQATAIGVAAPVPAAQAALVNGVLAHSLDYDDTHLPSVLHPSASVVPAALATAEAVGATGAELVGAVAVGVELCVRLGMAGYDPQARTSVFFDRGQHATSICGAVAGAASAAALRRLGPEEIAHAMGLAVSMASGVIEGNRTGGTVKRLHCGWAAHAAVVAADLAARGFTGPPTALEGRFGFFQAFLGDTADLGAVTAGLGADWELPGIFFKPYPANHFTHAGIDAALALRARGLEPDDVEELRLGVAAPTVRTIGQPIEEKRRPRSGYHGKFSGPYTVTAALVGGSGLGVGHDDFRDELVADPRRRALMDRIVVEGEPDCDAIFPHQFPAVVRVRTRDGSELVERVLANRGGPGNPLSDAELAAKFDDNARVAVDEGTAADLRAALDALEGRPAVAGLLAPLAEVG
jgi:2-methylcitrate dehydratase PrpD